MRELTLLARRPESSRVHEKDKTVPGVRLIFTKSKFIDVYECIL